MGASFEFAKHTLSETLLLKVGMDTHAPEQNAASQVSLSFFVKRVS